MGTVIRANPERKSSIRDGIADGHGGGYCAVLFDNITGQRANGRLRGAIVIENSAIAF